VTRVTLLGYVAGACTTLAFVPQVVRTWRTRSARDLSLGMFVVLTAGIALWLAYGLLTRDLPVIVANGVTLVLSAAILVMKLRGR
jgi:MtN3 and saliva related transmembrane protein